MRGRVWDAVVVGAGPAGALTARELTRGGARVLLVERDRFPRWTVCGACLGGAGVAALAAVGLGDLLGDLGARPLARLRIRGWGRRVDLAVEGGVVVSRRALDTALTAAAVSAGAVLRSGCTARLGPLDGAARVVHLREGGAEEEVRARIVVDAAGLTGLRAMEDDGPVAGVRVAPGSRIGVGALYEPGSHPELAADPGGVWMAVAPSGYVGLVLHEDATVGVAGAVAPDAVRAAGGPEGAVRRVLEAAGVAAPRGRLLEGWRGTPALTRRPGRRAAPRVFRVGDAAGYVEPFTGEGMSWALAGAVELAPVALSAIRGWSPGVAALWESRYRRGVGRRQLLSQAVARVSRHPAAARGLLALLEARPGLAAPLVRHAARPLVTGAAPRAALAAGMVP